MKKQHTYRESARKRYHKCLIFFLYSAIIISDIKLVKEAVICTEKGMRNLR